MSFKNDEFNELLSKAKDFSTHFLKFSPIVGFIFLNGYLSNFGAPFPIELQTLTILLLFMGVLSLLIVAMISGIIVIGGAYNIDPFDIGYSDILESICITKSDRKIFLLRSGHIFFSYFLPFLIGFTIFYYMDMPIGWLFGELFIVIATWSFCYGCLIGSKVARQHAKKTVCKVALHIVCTLSISFICCTLFLVYIFGLVKSLGDIETKIFFALVILYGFINTLSMYPERPVKKVSVKVVDIGSGLAEPKPITKELQNKNKPLLSPVLLFLILTGYGLTIPGVSYFIGRIPLRILHVGGEIDFVAQDKADNCAAWPDYIKAIPEKINTSPEAKKIEGNYCKSKVGKLIIKIKDTAYVVFEDSKGIPHLESLHVEGASTENQLPKDTLYSKPK